MIANRIQKIHRHDKFHDSSFFEIVFADDSKVHEKDAGWSAFSYEKVVDFMGQPKTVKVSVHPVKSIRIKHRHMETHIHIPKGCEVYQAFRSVSFAGGSSMILGREVGIIKDGKVIEERYLDDASGQVVGVQI